MHGLNVLDVDEYMGDGVEISATTHVDKLGHDIWPGIF